MSTKWKLIFSPLALKDLKSLDKSTQKLIHNSLYKKLEMDENPRRFGKPLSGRLKNLWRYRIDDHRAICEIKDHEFRIIALRIAHRKDVYNNLHFLEDSEEQFLNSNP
jgi:mRNA interferase RelE/StbE